MIINFYNIEGVIFENIDLNTKLLKHENFFKSYYLYKKIGDLNKIKKLKIDLINCLDQDDLNIIEKFLNEKIFIQKISDNITYSFCFDSSSSLSNYNLDYKDFCLHREKDKVFITLWR